jgi:hypothetical protein
MSSRFQEITQSTPSSSIIDALCTIYPVTLIKVKGKEYIKALEMGLYDLITVYTDPKKLNFLRDHKFSEIRTPAGNVRIIFMLHKKDDDKHKIALTLSYNQRNHYDSPKNAGILSYYDIYHKRYTINTDSPESPDQKENKLFIRVRNELNDIVKLEDNKFMWYYENDETFETIYINKRYDYYYNDEEEQEEKLEQEKEAPLKLRRKIMSDLKNNIMFKYTFGYQEHQFKQIRHNMWNYDIPYKKNNNKVIELLTITKKIFNNQYIYGYTDIYDELEETPADWSDDFINKNKINNKVDMLDINKINDEYALYKLDELTKYIESNNINFNEYNNLFYTSTPQDAFKSLLFLVNFYLEVILEEFDEDECVILTLIDFHYNCLIKYINIMRVLVFGSNVVNDNDENNILGTFDEFNQIIQNSFLYSKWRCYDLNEYNICSINDLKNHLTANKLYEDNKYLFGHIDNLNIITNKNKMTTKFMYKGCHIMTHDDPLYTIIYKEYKRITINERNELINKIVDILQRQKLNIYFSRQ